MIDAEHPGIPPGWQVVVRQWGTDTWDAIIQPADDHLCTGWRLAGGFAPDPYAAADRAAEAITDHLARHDGETPDQRRNRRFRELAAEGRSIGDTPEPGEPEVRRLAAILDEMTAILDEVDPGARYRREARRFHATGRAVDVLPPSPLDALFGGKLARWRR